MENQTNSQITIQDKGLIDSVLFLKQNNLLPESHSQVKFESVKEAEDSKKEEIIDVIKEKTNKIKEDITELQKAGYNLHLESIKLISVPLKQKVWLLTLARKDLELIFNIFNEVEKIILPLRQENQKKIAEREAEEKEKDAQEKKIPESKEIKPTLKTKVIKQIKITPKSK